MDPVTGALAAAAITAGVNSATSLFNNKSANDAARDNWFDSAAFNAAMYAQRYQTTVADMRAAGLNPILAATGGFSVQGAPQMAPAQTFKADTMPVNFTASAKDWAQADLDYKKQQEIDQGIKESAARIDQMTVQNQKTSAEVDVLVSQAEKNTQDIITSISQAAKNRAEANTETERAKNLAKDTELKIKEMESIATGMRKTEEEIKLVREQKTATELDQRRIREATATLAKQREEMDAKISELAELTKNLASEGVQLKTKSEVYSGTAGTILTWITEIGKSLTGPLASGAAAYGGAKLGKGGGASGGWPSYTVPKSTGYR